MDKRVCPYCRFPIHDGEDVVVCPSCETAHHADCWRENGGCARFGCPHSPGMRALNPLVVDLSPPRRAPGRGELLDACPHCLQPIPAGSRVCPWCGRETVAPLPSRRWWESSPLAAALAVVLSILITVGLILLIVWFLGP